jgi:hypothetical protein
MPFSNNTKRQRWEKGQVVPEYSTIMRVGSWGDGEKKEIQKRKEWAALSQTHSSKSKFRTILVRNQSLSLT